MRGISGHGAYPHMAVDIITAAADFTERARRVHLRVGSKIDGLDTAAQRSNYDCNELAIPTGTRVPTRSALDLLGDNP